ncbi:M20/M25/M40 family metallo-hydrolase [Agriterribacter sp.]|uniref:M20/M25/M40 family metallo-hydrolase n=1 Tax=Agriterribacter sp. TaxID=2821509 RepID=UPI002CDEAF58|nr:M20/M25/M40 family metallo-hydrolase [Agriterribacter sp.]HTN06327.1 M20/M25/M40 family metallo-hydrolase [Agriterribacter sp.]
MKYFLLFISLFFYSVIYSQTSIKGKNIFRHIEYLSCDALQGRWPGTKGDSIAGQYIKTAFSKSGVLPLFGQYDQPFDVIVKLDAPASGNFIRAGSEESLLLNKQYSIFPFSGSAILEAPVLFAGDNAIAFSAQQHSKPCWIVLWRHKTADPATDSLSDYALSVRAMQNGAAGVILISPDSVDSKDVLVRLRPRRDKPIAIPVVQLTRKVWQQMQAKLFSGTTAGDKNYYLSAALLSGSVNIRQQKVIARNIVGIIKGSDPQLQNEYIVLGAHYDHLGYGGFGTGSLKPDTTAIHNGADDNASGTAALLEIAKALQRNQKQLKRSVIVVAFAAEEEGLLGSQYFTDHLPVSQSAIKVMLNMDMVGRLNAEHQLYMGGAGTFPGGVDFMKSLGEGSGLNVVVHAGGVGGSDHVSFYRKGISCIGLHTGGHPQYHTPADDAELIHVAGIEKVARYIYRAVYALSVRKGEWGFIKQE